MNWFDHLFYIHSAVQTVVVLALIWVPILRKLRRKVNKLIDEIGVIV